MSSCGRTRAAEASEDSALCSARRKASCTRLIVFIARSGLPALLRSNPRQMVIHRAGHQNTADDDRARPRQPRQAPLTADQQRIFEQWDAAQYRHIGISPDVFQVLE